MKKIRSDDAKTERPPDASSIVEEILALRRGRTLGKSSAHSLIEAGREKNEAAGMSSKPVLRRRRPTTIGISRSETPILAENVDEYLRGFGEDR